MKLKEILPIGYFIINNANGVQGVDGVYYHYADVCSLLRKYVKEKFENAEEDLLKTFQTVNKSIDDEYKNGYLEAIKNFKEIVNG